MNKTIEIPDIVQWEETDSELAKYTIQSLSSLIKNQEEQLKANDLMINELINRIDKAIELLEELISDTKGIINAYNYEDKEETIKRYIEDLETDIKHYEHLLDILRGEDNDNND
jgi:hypothetical protein